MYFPEIKVSSGKLSLDNNFRVKDMYPNISWVGDACTGGVGIVPSAIAGIEAVKSLI